MNVAHETLEKRFGEPVLAFADPDGMRLALVGVADAGAELGWSDGDVPAEHAIRGFHGVTLLLDDVAATGAMLAALGVGSHSLHHVTCYGFHLTSSHMSFHKPENGT
jgi:hypothetical protein